MAFEKLSEGLWRAILVIVIIVCLVLTNCCVTQNSINGQGVLSKFMDALNHSSSDYVGFYKREYEVHGWSGGSGATDYNEKSKIFMEVSDGQIVNYARGYVKKGFPIDGEDFFEYYDKSQNKLCIKGLIAHSPCNSTPLIPPVLGKPLIGCKVTFDNLWAYCMCKGRNSLISYSGFGCSEETSTDDMELMYGNAIVRYHFYWGEPKKFCYYIAKNRKTNQFWAFECANQNFTLTPLVTEPFEIYSCKKYGNECTCELHPGETSGSCYSNIPENFDLGVKKEIISHLNEIDLRSLLREIDSEYGTCYYVFYKNLKQTFCFDNQDLITYAQWGWNESTKRSTNINIHTIKKSYGEYVNKNELEDYLSKIDI